MIVLDIMQLILISTLIAGLGYSIGFVWWKNWYDYGDIKVSEKERKK